MKNHKKSIPVEIDGKWYVCKSVSQSKTGEDLGMVPVRVPNPMNTYDDQLSEFCEIIELDYNDALASYVAGKGIALQAKARRIASGDTGTITDAERATIIDAMEPAERDRLFAQGYATLLARVAKIIMENRSKNNDKVYNKDYVWKMFL